MLAWTRSLMKRDWSSSSYSPGQSRDQVVVERRPALGAAAGGLPVQLLHHGGNGLELLGDDQPAHFVMAEIGAFAHRLDGGGGCSRRRASPCSSFSTRPVQEPQEAEALVWARTSSRVVRPLPVIAPMIVALADAVAAADFGVVRQGGNGGQQGPARRRPERPGRRSACRASSDIGVRFLSRSKIPGAVGGIAVEHGADDAVVLQDERACRRRATASRSTISSRSVAFGEIAGREEVDAGDLELGRRSRTARKPPHRRRRVSRASDLGHLVERRDEAIDAGRDARRIRRARRCRDRRCACGRRRRCRD